MPSIEFERTDLEHADPTLVRVQPQLTSASGTTWLVVAAATAVLVGTMLLIVDEYGEWGVASAVILGVLAISMWQVRILVGSIRTRLRALAVLYGTMLAVALTATLVVAASGA